jgi:hypothetical protein
MCYPLNASLAFSPEFLRGSVNLRDGFGSVGVDVRKLSTVLAAVLRFFATSETALNAHINRGFFQLGDIGITDNRAHQT